MKAEFGPSIGGGRSDVSSGRIGSVGTISRGPSAEGRSGFSSRALSVPFSRISNPGLKVSSYINPKVGRNEAFTPFGMPKSPENSLRPTNVTSKLHLEKSVLGTPDHESKRYVSISEHKGLYSKKIEGFKPSDQAKNIYRNPKIDRRHRHRPGRSFQQEIPNIKHNLNYQIKKSEKAIVPLIERIPTHVMKSQSELFTPLYTVLKKEKLKSPAIELSRLPRDRIDISSPQLRLVMLRQVKTVRDRRTQLRPGLGLDTPTALKTQIDLLRSTESQNNIDPSTATELIIPVAKRARHDQLKDDEDKQFEEIVLYNIKTITDKPTEDKEDEPQRFDQDAQANEARKEIIIKAIKWATIEAKNKEEALTGKDVNLPKKPSGDALSELARELGIEHDGSWSALVYVLQAVGKIDHRIDKFIQSAIYTFTAVRRRKRPAKPATKENAHLVVGANLSIENSSSLKRSA